MTQEILALVDIDDESSGQIVLSAAADHARHTGSRLHVLNIVPDSMLKMTIVAQPIQEDYEEKLIEDAKRRLKDLVSRHATQDVAIEEIVHVGGIYREALHYARDVGADLIVMGAHRPEVMDFLLGSNASQIVAHAQCSVWIVRP